MRNLAAAWIVIAGFVLAGCDRTDANQPANSPQEPYLNRAATPEQEAETEAFHPTIVAFGNSLTAGHGIASEQSYPSLLDRRLREMGYAARVVNAGVSGDTTAGGLRRLDWILRAGPEIVILELGANDGLRGQDLDVTKDNLSRIITRLRDEGITVILAGMKIPPNYGPQYTSKFTQMFIDLSREHDLPLVPFFLEGVAAEPGLNQSDGLHPNAEGYKRVVDNILPVLLPILESHAAPRRQ